MHGENVPMYAFPARGGSNCHEEECKLLTCDLCEQKKRKKKHMYRAEDVIQNNMSQSEVTKVIKLNYVYHGTVLTNPAVYRNGEL